jgi:CTP synthase
VQVIPHITNGIKERVHRVAKRPQSDVVITRKLAGLWEIIESFTVFGRQFASFAGCLGGKMLAVYARDADTLDSFGFKEMKTKPTQHSVERITLDRSIQP